MTKYKYLITGKYGLIGSSLVRLFKENSEPFLSISRNDLNLLDYEKTTNFFILSIHSNIKFWIVWGKMDSCYSNSVFGFIYFQYVVNNYCISS